MTSLSQTAEPAAPTRGNRFRFALLNVVGGLLVLGSYGVGLATHPESRGAVWGGVPEGLQPLYTVCMLLAAAGYFFFTYYVFFRLDADRVRVFERFGFEAFEVIYAGILLPSALWMPLTFRMIAMPDPLLWMAIRIVLFVVGISSLALIAAIARARPAGPDLSRRLGLAGAVPFAFQTAVLDAIIWPAYFPV